MYYNLKEIETDEGGIVDIESGVIKTDISKERLEKLIEEYEEDAIWSEYLSKPEMVHCQEKCRFVAFVLFLKDKGIDAEYIPTVDVVLGESDSS